MKKSTIIWIVVVIIILVIAFFAFSKKPAAPVDTTQDQGGSMATTTGQMAANPATTSPTQIIGSSVNGNPIVAYHYGTGPKELLFVGGIHGGYEWNTVLVAQQLSDYLTANPSAVPSSLTVTVIPVLNPDGLLKVTGTTTGDFTAANVASSQTTQIAGRFNANKVDLNRNFDCDWQATGTWQSTPVSGGTAAFSEPESQAIRDYVAANKPAAVIVYYSAAGGVYASSCGAPVSSATDQLVKTYADGSGYTAHEAFDSYPTSGDMTNWLAKIGVPSASVLLTNHTDTEWTKNLAGIKAVIAQYAY